MKELEELLAQIDEKTIENISEPRKRLVLFLKEICSNQNGGDCSCLKKNTNQD